MSILRHRMLMLINSIWVLPTVLVIRLLRPFLNIRIGRIFSGRIGHFVPDTLEHYSRALKKSNKSFDIYYLFGGISNTQWEKMTRRNLRIGHPFLKYIWHWNLLLPGNKDQSMPQSYTNSRDIYGFLSDGAAKFKFEDFENRTCQEWLRKKGWKEGEPWVCFQIRDSEFLTKFDFANPNDKTQYDHSFRDSNIETYIKSMLWLAKNGYWVLRMGKLAKIPLPELNSRIIDYVFDDSKSDLLDVWLFANCSFCVSTSSGPDWISLAYGQPVLYLNALPIGNMPTFSHCTWVPKKLKWKRNQLSLNLNEHLNTQAFVTHDYLKTDVEIEDLSENEILEYVCEFVKTINASNKYQVGDMELHNEFWRIFTSHHSFQYSHNFIHPNCIMSSIWLSKMKVLGFLNEERLN